MTATSAMWPYQVPEPPPHPSLEEFLDIKFYILKNTAAIGIAKLWCCTECAALVFDTMHHAMWHKSLGSEEWA